MWQLAALGAATALGGAGAMAAGDAGEQKIEYKTPQHASVSQGLLADPAMGAITAGTVPKHVEDSIRGGAFEKEKQASDAFSQFVGQVPSSAPGLRLKAAQDMTAQTLTSSALSRISATGTFKNQMTELAAGFAEMKRNTPENQHQNMNEGKWGQIAGGLMGAGGMAVQGYMMRTPGTKTPPDGGKGPGSTTWYNQLPTQYENGVPWKYSPPSSGSSPGGALG